MPQAYIPPLRDVNRGTINPTQYGRTGTAYTDPNTFKLYMAQQNQNNVNILFGDEEQFNNSIFGDTSVFGATPSSTSTLFGGVGSATLPSDLAGLSSTGGIASGSQYFELIAKSYLIGKTVEAVDPNTHKTFTGKVISVHKENEILKINVGGVDVLPENIIKVSQ